MAMIRCDAGLHFFNSDQHSSCPFCRKVPVGEETKPVPAPPSPRPKTEPIKLDVKGKTRRITPEGMDDVDPVVGWLVCVDGPSRGKDFRIRAGKNFVGRDPKNTIQIADDDTISGERHAVIRFSYKSGEYHFQDDKNTNENYVNDEEVMMPVKLKRGDRILVGKTLLLFVPLCDDDFRWGEEK
jgi:FHA domain